jgi:hypothetical protein
MSTHTFARSAARFCDLDEPRCKLDFPLGKLGDRLCKLAA